MAVIARLIVIDSILLNKLSADILTFLNVGVQGESFWWDLRGKFAENLSCTLEPCHGFMELGATGLGR